MSTSELLWGLRRYLTEKPYEAWWHTYGDAETPILRFLIQTTYESDEGWAYDQPLPAASTSRQLARAESWCRGQLGTPVTPESLEQEPNFIEFIGIIGERMQALWVEGADIQIGLLTTLSISIKDPSNPPECVAQILHHPELLSQAHRDGRVELKTAEGHEVMWWVENHQNYHYMKFSQGVSLEEALKKTLKV